MEEVTTNAQALSSAVRSHSFPTLESGNLSFPYGRYIVGFERGMDDCSFTIRHRIEGANLINDVIEDGLIEFVCTVASPISSYRVSHRSSSNVHDIQWDNNDLGEPPMFTPMLVVTKPFSRELNLDRDGVHELWHGRTVNFESGMRLALSDVVIMRSSVFNMLLFEHDPSLHEGSFHVMPEPREGFRFRVRLATELFQFLKYDQGYASRNHILTHIASACFSILKLDWAKDDDEEGGWRSYRGLQALSEVLEKNELLHWSDNDFQPEFVATTLYPHVVDRDNIDEDED